MRHVDFVCLNMKFNSIILYIFKSGLQNRGKSGRRRVSQITS